MIFLVFLDGNKQIGKQTDIWKCVRVDYPILILKVFICFLNLRGELNEVFLSIFILPECVFYSVCHSEKWKLMFLFKDGSITKAVTGICWLMIKDLNHKFRAHTTLARNIFNCEDEKQRIWVNVELMLKGHIVWSVVSSVHFY